MLEKRFNHLEKPLISQYEDYLPTAFSGELTLLQKVNKIIQDLNRSFDSHNEMVEYLNYFIETFDKNIYKSVYEVLEKWREDGFLSEIASDILGVVGELRDELNNKISVMEANTNEKVTKINTRLSNITTQINTIHSYLENEIEKQKQKSSQIETNLSNMNVDFNSKINQIKSKVDNIGGFNVVDTVDTHTTLISKYPNGTNGLVGVYDENSWYIYNNGWKKGGNFTSNSNVPISNLTFTTSENLFNKNKRTLSNYVLYTDGKLYESADFDTTDFMPVKPNETYYISTNQQIAFYSNNNLQSYVGGVEDFTEVLIPNNVNYVRTNVRKRDIDNFYFGLYVSMPQKYEARIDKSYLDVKTNLILSSLEQSYIKSRNLFDYTKVTYDMYVDYTTGKLNNNQDFVVSDFIRLKPHTTYYRSNKQQVAFYKNNNPISDPYYDYLGGQEEGYFFTTYEQEIFVRISIPKTELYTYMFCESNVPVAYEPYGYIKKETTNSTINITNPTENFEAKIASLNNDEVLFLSSGVYETSLKLANFSGVLIGLGKVVFTNDYGDYNRPPLDISGNGYIENITFLARKNTTPSELKPYALHMDKQGEGEMVFKDCVFISESHQGVGIGMWDNQTIIFDRCEFFGKSNGFYAHSNINHSTPNQNIILNHCYCYSTDEESIRIDDSNQIFGNKQGTTLDCTFIGNIFAQANSNIPLFKPNPDPILGISGNVRLNERSSNNNEVLLNSNKDKRDNLLKDYLDGKLGGTVSNIRFEQN